MKKDLTERQKEVFEFIKEYIEFNSFPPTYREIGAQFNIVSTFGVKRHIDALIKKGYLNTEQNMSRTISLTGINESKSANSSMEEIIEIPIVGRVAAGQPILAEQNIEGTLSLQASLINKRDNCFGLKVKGDSMINAGIFEGDVVVINPQQNANNGEIVVALLGDEATLKRFERTGNQVYLIPENENYQKINVNKREDFSIVGKVLGVFRWYN